MSGKESVTARWLNKSPDDPLKTTIIAIALCLVCSVLVASSAILLQPIQLANDVNEKRKNILEVAGIYDPSKSIEEQFKVIETRVVDFSSGQFDRTIDSDTFDMFDKNKNSFSRLAEDPAKIVSMPRFASIYLVKDEQDNVSSVILPVYGYGLWSTMYGFIALQPDLNHISGLKFYDQRETPGLGAEVDNPIWRKQWENKKIFSEDGELMIHVSKGASSSAEADYGVDAISGASMTSRGVHNLLRFWLGEQGFQAFIQNFQEELTS